MKQKGIADLLLLGLTAVVGALLVFSVILPIYNGFIVNNATGTPVQASNFTSYTGAATIMNASYLVLTLGALAIAAGLTFGYFKIGG